MNQEIKQPTLKELIDKMKAEGGYLKGKGDGRVHWKPSEELEEPKWYPKLLKEFMEATKTK